MTRTLMVYPRSGFLGSLVRHMPLSLLYASAELVRQGWEVDVLDIRLHQDDWEEELAARLTPDVGVVGVSVITGRPIASAISVSRAAKRINPAVKVVWGGPHPTFFPGSCLEEPCVDYELAGYGRASFFQLVQRVAAGREPGDVPGVSFRADGRTVTVPYERRFEEMPFQDIPYGLLEDIGLYGQLDQKKVIFPMYSRMGCPYRCAFCSSPAFYGQFARRTVALEAGDVADHVQHVVETYGANYIYFLDDDSFVDLEHVRRVIAMIRQRELPVQLGFRGARINEIRGMDDAFLDMLEESGTDIMHIGAESGSDRILRLIRKDCTVADILDVNRKLARHPGILAAYNFIVGLPTETADDLAATKDLMLRLVDENPTSLIFAPNKFRPLPGTELFALVQEQWGHQVAGSLQEWMEFDNEGDFLGGWCDRRSARIIDLLILGSYFIDDKIVNTTEGKGLGLAVVRFLCRMYKPIARFRLRHLLYHGLLEKTVFRIASRHVSAIL